jgi:hypothetical protein
MEGISGAAFLLARLTSLRKSGKSKKMIKFISLPILFITILSTQALALPLAPKYRVQSQLSPLFTADYDFEGIVGLSNCSGSIIRFENSLDTDKAWVMTNGHCRENGFTQPGTAVFKEVSHRPFTVLDSHGEEIGTLYATELTYSTMTGTDISLYRVNSTYADILSKYQIHALILKSQPPQASDNIEIISGYWLRGYQCSIETFIYQLKEAGWLWTNSLRFSRPGCETIGGTSGSPIIRKGTRDVIAINNTGNDDGDHCSMDNPCEVDEKGNIQFVKGYSYGQQTYQIYSCLNDQREIDLSKPGCALTQKIVN